MLIANISFWAFQNVSGNVLGTKTSGDMAQLQDQLHVAAQLLERTHECVTEMDENGAADLSRENCPRQ